MPEYVGREQAEKAAKAYQTPRFLRLAELERWVEGTQYDGRPDWWSGGAKEVPLWERKPCVTYPAVQNAIESNTDLVLGEGRFPTITARPDEDESEDADGEDEEGTDDAESDALDKFIRDHHRVSRFRAHAKEALDAAQGCGTAVAIHGHRNGRPFADLVPARWCTPKFNTDNEVTELDIRYVFFVEQRLPDGRWEVKAKLFRRLITEDRDTTFIPAEAREDGSEPNWRPDPNQTISHGLGFCPVIWYPFLRKQGPINQIDGMPIHHRKTDKIEALDRELSVVHRSALYSEGQIVEIGVDPEHNPTGDMGRLAQVPSTEKGGLLPDAPGYVGGDPGEKTGAFVARGQIGNARKKGPNHVWRYPDPATRVEMLAQQAHVIKNLEEKANDTLSKLEESLAVVLPRPTQFKFAGAVSGKSLIEMKRRQYDRCDKIRDDFGDNFMLPSISMQLRIAQRARQNLKITGIEQVLPILDKFADDATMDAA